MTSATDKPDATGETLDPAELAHFSALAAEWWDPTGKFRTLHIFNPVRLAFIRDEACAHFGRDARSRTPLEGLRVLDIGCGGGLLSEPVARMGGSIVGADPARRNVETARIHAEQSGVAVDYRCASAEDLAADGETFDIILNMEVIEHVADVDLFLDTCCGMVKPGGLMFIATLNRTAKSYALAIVGAEYILRWLPRGTHSWDKFVSPEEIDAGLERNGMAGLARSGVIYNILRSQWQLSPDMDVNYMILAGKDD